MKGTILTYYPGRTKPDVCSLDGVGCAPDFLVGQIAVVFGDAEFMETL